MEKKMSKIKFVVGQKVTDIQDKARPEFIITQFINDKIVVVKGKNDRLTTRNVNLLAPYARQFA
jgi:hypothetical protein